MTTATEPSTAIRSFSELFIGGSWVKPSSDRLIEVVSPTTEEVIAHVPEAAPVDPDDVDALGVVRRERQLFAVRREHGRVDAPLLVPSRDPAQPTLGIRQGNANEQANTRAAYSGREARAPIRSR